MIHILLSIYNLLWHLALPLLKRKRRTSFGWSERTLQIGPKGPFDLWIQAASGGESMLTNMILQGLSKNNGGTKPYKVLLTSGTKEGVDSLNKGTDLISDEHFEIHIAYFPFDAPSIMEKALTLFSPRLIVILETELWPAFLITAKKRQVPVLLFNARMSDKSAGSYAKFHRFFSTYGPEKIWAISELDQKRFIQVMGNDRVERMDNIKFDRIIPVHDPAASPALAALLPADKPFLLLGSIRQEEEEKILWAVQKISAARPDVTIGIFPKHITRADHWQDLLRAQNISSMKRSEISQTERAEGVIIWDVFGELAAAYNLAKTTFVGGSLVNLGGQNFLEPLVFGLRPVIGPYWRNFGWVGRDIVAGGLVTEVENEEALVSVLLERLDQNIDRSATLDEVQQYFEPKKGGTEFVCQQIIKKLDAINNL